MTAITTAIGDVIEMILSAVTSVFGFVTDLTPVTEGGVAFGHFFFIGIGIALLLVAINCIKRLVWGA